MQSNERYEIIKGLLAKGDSAWLGEAYAIINRVRNLVYQEDPKWASRHPSYGSSPYYDMQGLAYLELADRLLDHLLSAAAGRDNEVSAVLKDWDVDGQDEVLIETPTQTVSIDLQGGCINYHHVIAPHLSGDARALLDILKSDIEGFKAYNSVYRYSCPLVLTETESSMQNFIYAEGGRRENCRNSLRCNVVKYDSGIYTVLGKLEAATYRVQMLKACGNSAEAGLYLSAGINDEELGQLDMVMEKTYRVSGDEMTVVIKASTKDKNRAAKLFLAPQIVSSAAPSDEVNFKPTAYLGFRAAAGAVECVIEDIQAGTAEGIDYQGKTLYMEDIRNIDYIYSINSANGDRFQNLLSIEVEGDVRRAEIKPAVIQYYEGLVFENQSRLGYNSSGIMIIPYVPFIDGQAEIKIRLTWKFDSPAEESDYLQTVNLIDV